MMRMRCECGKGTDIGSRNGKTVELQLWARASMARSFVMFDLFKRKVADAPADTAGRWSERLKSGLSLSRDRLAGTLAGVFSRRKWCNPPPWIAARPL